jgi:hypothetical protein
MKELIAEVELLNRVSGEYEQAYLHRGIDDKNFDDFEQRWRPLFDERRLQLLPPGDSESAALQDAHWDWRRVIKPRENRLDYESFSLECAEQTQGLMLVCTTAFGRCANHAGREIVYVDRIATAPWNRQGFSTGPIYRGVGSILLAAAISLSDDLGFGGRLGLHSLPQSERWYKSVCSMTDLGVDADSYNLRYFEMTEAQAKSFIS